MHTKSKMWTLDCEDYVKNLKNDSIFELRRRRRRRRRLRRQFLHLMPIIPTSSNSSSKAGPPPLPPPLPLPLPLPISSSSNAENFSWKDHLMSKVEKKNKISSVEEEEETATAEAALVVSSTRWNPTPEQLKALQEMYQRGVRTPSAEEIQLIAAKLRHFGRIEGKNVFYWFQNHKARERQKRRRHQPPDYYYSSTSTFFSENIGGTLQHDCPKQTSLCWKQMDAEQNNKKLVTPSNCSLLPKGSASIHETAVTESRSNGWIHLDEKKRRQQQIFHTKTAAKAVSSTSGDKILWADEENRDDDNSSENRVLQLFPIIIGQEDDPDPIRFSTTDNKNIMDAEEVSSTLLSSKFTPNQFYEFL